MSAMGLFDVFRKAEKRKPGHFFDDDDREASKQTRLMKQQLQQMQFEMQQLQMERRLEMERAQLERLRQELRGDDDDEESDKGGLQEMMMLSLLKNLNPAGEAAQPGMPQTVTTSPTTSAAPSFLHYTDEQIMDILDKLPKAQRKMLDLAPEQLLKAKMRELFNADDDSIRRAIILIKEK